MLFGGESGDVSRAAFLFLRKIQQWLYRTPAKEELSFESKR
jgi:hypothetical protein